MPSEPPGKGPHRAGGLGWAEVQGQWVQKTLLSPRYLLKGLSQVPGKKQGGWDKKRAAPQFLKATTP